MDTKTTTRKQSRRRSRYRRSVFVLARREWISHEVQEISLVCRIWVWEKHSIARDMSASSSSTSFSQPLTDWEYLRCFGWPHLGVRVSLSYDEVEKLNADVARFLLEEKAEGFALFEAPRSLPSELSGLAQPSDETPYTPSEVSTPYMSSDSDDEVDSTLQSSF